MIEIDGEKYSLKQREDLNWNTKKKAPYDLNQPYFNPKKYHVFRLAKHMFMKGYKSVKDGTRGRGTGPRSIQLDPFYSIETEKGTTTLRFARNKNLSRAGSESYWEYLPVYVEFPQAGQIVTKDPEMWYWLINHPRCAGSPNKTKKKALFYLEDKQAEAAAKVEAIRTKSRAEELILALEDEELVTLAQFHGMANAGNPYVSDDERRAYLLAIDSKRVLDSHDSDDVEMTAKIMSAVDHKIIKFMPPGRKWHFCDSNTGQLKDIIMTVRPQQDKFDALVMYLKKYDKHNTFKVICGLLEEKEKAVEVE